MIVEEEYEEDAATFAYNSLVVALSMLFDQIDGFTLHPRDGSTLLPITSMAKITPDIKMLEKYFALRNPRWIDQHGKTVRRKPEGIEVELPKPAGESDCS